MNSFRAWRTTFSVSTVRLCFSARSNNWRARLDAAKTDMYLFSIDSIVWTFFSSLMTSPRNWVHLGYREAGLYSRNGGFVTTKPGEQASKGHKTIIFKPKL